MVNVELQFVMNRNFIWRNKLNIIKPVSETKINRAVFLNQDLVVYPYGRIPDNLSEAVKFLFGEGAIVTLDDRANHGRIKIINANHGRIKIINANFVLENVKTLDADFLVTKKE